MFSLRNHADHALRYKPSRRAFLLAAALAGCATRPSLKRDALQDPSARLIGYTEYRTNLPTRYDNQITARAYLVRADGTDRSAIAPKLADEPHAWTQFGGWSPDGQFAVIGRGWESPENGAWEETHQTFRMTVGWLYDMFLYDMQEGSARNVTEVERVSDYNSGLIFVPGPDGGLGFTALINGVSHPYMMDWDGRNKRDMTAGKAGFTYGVAASPDGRHIAYHKDYQIYIGDAAGSQSRHIDTGNPFNFVPQWSPDGAWLLFLSGEHYDCHPCVVRPDGSDFRKLADRGDYDGVMTVYDVYDFHGGSSDVPVWSPDGEHVYYTARVNGAVDLMRVSLDGTVAQLTESAPGVHTYHPKPSPDGQFVAFGSTRSGLRQLYVMPANGGDALAITKVPEGHGAMHAHWRPSMQRID